MIRGQYIARYIDADSQIASETICDTTIRKASNAAGMPREAQQLPRYSPNTACPIKDSSKHIHFNHHSCLVKRIVAPDRKCFTCPGVPKTFHAGARKDCTLTCMTLRHIYSFISTSSRFAKERISNILQEIK